ncbi:Nipped-B-like protein B [Durusdinium trenchii]|uniref:Nipped-B-like protein B n=1 Tax=Durusdinium trenchii TaxID=1381693 RepID=A0ABP0N8R4_9DINO
MIGSGRISVATAADISRANTADTGDAAPAAIQALASLGAGGTQLQNQERDLHRWVPNEEATSEQMIPVLLPHEIFHAIAMAGSRQVRCGEWEAVKTATHKLVAEVISWSMKIALEGIGPAVGFRGEKLEDINLRLIAMSLWSLQEALHILDHSGLIVLKEDAEVGVCENTQFTVR